INYNLFSRAVYSEQNEIDFFLRLSPRDRGQRFDELLDLKRYETVRANAVYVANKLKDTAKYRAGFLAKQRAALKPGEEESLQKRIEDKEKENAEWHKKIPEKEKELRLLQEEVAAIEKKEEEFNLLRDLQAKTTGRIEELREAVRETTKEAKGRSPAELLKEKKRVAEELQAKEKELRELEEKLDCARKAAGDSEKSAAVNERKMRELQQHLLQLKGLKAACPVCKRKLEERTKEELVRENSAEQKKTSAENEVLEKSAGEARKKVQQAEAAIRKAREEKEQCREREIELLHIGKKLEALAEKEKQLKQLEEENCKLGKEIEKSGFDEKHLRAKRNALAEEKAGIEIMRRNISANEEVAAGLRERLQQMEKAREQLRLLEEKIKRIEQNAEKMSLFINSLLSAQSQLRQMLVETINRAMDSAWRMLYPYEDFVSAKMDVEEGSYELKAKTRNGKWVRVEGILSGGERSAAAICIRIAFSLVLTQNLSWLILDEPTHNLDGRAVAALSGMMQNSLPGMVEQIFVITHDEQMKKAATASLYALERDKNNDAATRPVQLPLEA
ncbi:MAG: hypothetical protein NTW59_00835, partial [Candidatus Diapherotrites archaeon]|nr:hypothetical protein [Candidatus Diapherotrites archaeon]